MANKAVSSFFKKKVYSEWSISACLDFVSSNNDVNADDIEPILDHIKKKLQSISDDRNNLVCARQKALSIYSSFDKAIKRPEIQNVLQTMIKKSEVESRKRLYRETMKIKNINDKMAVSPDTKLTEELEYKGTSDDDFLDKHFAARSRDLKFYDFPAYWKDETIYEMLKKVGYIERLEVKWNYKYRTVRARIRLTKEMEDKFLKGGSNIAITRNDRTFFFRMFDAKLDASAIKKRCEWQAYRKLDKEELDKKDEEIIKDYNAALGRHFAKVIKINKIKYILMYFNNENDLLKAIYKSTMEEDLGKGLKIKLQDELIGDNGMYKPQRGINRFKVPTQTISKDKFVDARTELLSTIPRTEEEHRELDDLNNNFSGRLEDLDKNKRLPEEKRTKTEDKEEYNKNKKRVVTTQGHREESDSE
ncbi:hypothetical protein RhiirA1_441485 [Rhizophagus irregularis]|uniref:Uncharacterized protein n=1 Tax=Rhizophagus irregularis TaxID=588596 RepID=A0A2N0RU89_9GLOM|nr:hypothetical protein RhiirA1_441485 [Rhizophagus irregularis]